MIKFSFIMGTLGRLQEVLEFLGSLELQKYKYVECIIVDQNATDELRTLIHSRKYSFVIKYLQSPKGLSRARNVGLAQATGDIIAYPDDDCKYPPNLLMTVLDFFAAHPDCDIVTGRAVDEKTMKSSCGNWISTPTHINPRNILKTAISFTIFIRKTLTTDSIVFNERLGVGAEFGSSEETDYLLRLITAGSNAYYTPNITVYHPDKGIQSTGNAMVARNYAYGRGMGALFKIHLFCGGNIGMLYSFLFLFIVRPLCGTLIGVLTGNRIMSTAQIASLRGRWEGLLKYER